MKLLHIYIKIYIYIKRTWFHSHQSQTDLTVWFTDMSLNPHPGNMNLCQTNQKLEAVFQWLTMLQWNYCFGGCPLDKEIDEQERLIIDSRRSGFRLEQRPRRMSGTTPQVPQAHEWESLLCNKYYKSLYGDLSDRYLGVKNSNKRTSEFLTLSFCLNLWCVLQTA